VKRRGTTTYLKWNKGRLADLFTSCAGTAFQSTFLREISEG